MVVYISVMVVLGRGSGTVSGVLSLDRLPADHFTSSHEVSSLCPLHVVSSDLTALVTMLRMLVVGLSVSLETWLSAHCVREHVSSSFLRRHV